MARTYREGSKVAQEGEASPGSFRSFAADKPAGSISGLFSGGAIPDLHGGGDFGGARSGE